MKTCLALLIFTFFIFPRTLVANPASSFLSSENYVHPAQASLVSSAFGIRKHPVLSGVKHHSGIDLPSPEGSPVRALSKGIVIKTGAEIGYGNLVIVLHEGGLTTLYAHLRDFRVQVGQAVKGGEILGRVGSTGRVTGPHLHFEVRRDGEAVDPLDVLPFLRARAEG